MNQQERESLTHFLMQLREAQVPQKDDEAETLIREAVSKQPDAAYLLVQRALLTNLAVEGLKAQNAQLQNELQALKASSAPSSGEASFLGNNPWTQQFAPNAVASGAPVPGAGTYQIPRAAAPASNASASGVSSFLGSVASTAVGVAAGSFLFQGIEHMFGHDGAGVWGGGSNGLEPVSENTVINNYYVSAPDGAADEVYAADFSASDSDDDVTGDDSTWV